MSGGSLEKEKEGTFVTKDMEGKTFYSACRAGEGLLGQLTIKEVDYTHTTIEYPDGKESTFATGNQGKGAYMWEVLTLTEAKEKALEALNKQKTELAIELAKLDERIKEITNAS